MPVNPVTGESLFVVVVIFGFFSWGSVVRVVRSEVRAAREYVTTSSTTRSFLTFRVKCTASVDPLDRRRLGAGQLPDPVAGRALRVGEDHRPVVGAVGGEVAVELRRERPDRRPDLPLAGLEVDVAGLELRQGGLDPAEGGDPVHQTVRR